MKADVLNTRCSLPEMGSARKKRKPETSLNSTTTELSADEDDDEVESTVENEIILMENAFKPLNYIATWKEPKTMTKRITAPVVLPTGDDAGPSQFVSQRERKLSY